MAVGDKIFLDTDVALDHLANRQPFAEYAHRVFALAEKGEITLCLSALSFSNLYAACLASTSEWGGDFFCFTPRRVESLGGCVPPNLLQPYSASFSSP